MRIRAGVCYSLSLGGQDAMGYLRIVGPFREAAINVINGVEDGQAVTQRVSDADIVIFQREFPGRFDDYRAIVGAARREGKPIVVDLDDLLFFLPENHPDRQANYFAPSILPLFQALLEADLVTVTTSKLRDMLASYNRNVVVLPNYLDASLWQLRPPVFKSKEEVLTIGYMGGDSHKADLAFVTPVLLDLLERYPRRIRYRFWGAEPPRQLLSRPQVEWTPSVTHSYQEFAAFFQTQSADIFIAPLVDNVFNRSKSALKFLEYSALGAPGVFSRLETYADAVVHRTNGLLASSLEEWADCLVELIESSNQRVELAANAQITIEARWLLSKNAFRWREAFQAALEQMPSRVERKSPMLEFVESANRQLVEAFGAAQSRLAAQEHSLQALSAQVQALSAQVAELQAARQQLSEILNSKLWKFALIFRAVRLKLLPAGSWRFSLVRNAYRALSVWRTDGLMALVRHLRSQAPYRDYYQAWIRRNEPDHGMLKKERMASKRLPSRPLITIVTPVYETPAGVLRATVESVTQQTYDNWELCIANASPDSDSICKVLDLYASKDPRIKVLALKQNLGIAGNTNAAIGMATGDFVGFLDHDDLLAPFALFEVARVLAENPAVDLCYSDEDKISADGRERYGAFFKPAFSPDLIRSVNYVAHFLVVRRKLGEEIGWIREGFEGAQDYDLVLRVAEKATQIAHIPQVLYHWRALPSSTALAASAKGYATESGIKSIQDHLRRMNISGIVSEGYAPSTYRITRSLTDSPLVSIIIPNKDHADDLEQCIHSILEKSSYRALEILVVENSSQEDATFSLYEKLRQSSNVRVLEHVEQPFNYSSTNNYGARQARGGVLLFLNNDTQVINSDWLERMLEHALRPEIGAVGAKLYYPDYTVQHAGAILGIGGVAGHSHKRAVRDSAGYFGRLMLTQNLSAVTAACLMSRKDVFEEVGGFDPKYRLAFGDMDFCMKIREKGYLVVWTPYAELFHHESKTRGYEDTQEKLQRHHSEAALFRRAWAATLERGDEYYSPNLTLEREDFGVNPRQANASVRLQRGFWMNHDGPKAIDHQGA